MKKLLLILLAVFTVNASANDCILAKELNVEFKNDSTRFMDHAHEMNKIKEFSDFIKQTGLYVLIEGHTNNLAPAEYNYDLSQRRALKVRNVLRKLGVAKTHVRAMGFGETTPLYDNNTKTGLKKNRRVIAEIFNSAKEMNQYITEQYNRVNKIKFVEQ